MTQFLWSDAWLFQAIALASQAGPARLSQVIGAADGVNHALPTVDELHGALVRLTAGGFVSEAEERFTITELVPLVTLSSIRNSGLQAGRRVASKFLRAEEWTPERNTRDPRNQVVYEGLTDERLHKAEREYRQRLKSTDR
jgi:hypothetical protein